jgi:hypothetical protein
VREREGKNNVKGLASPPGKPVIIWLRLHNLESLEHRYLGPALFQRTIIVGENPAINLSESPKFSNNKLRYTAQSYAEDL